MPLSPWDGMTQSMVNYDSTATEIYWSTFLNNIEGTSDKVEGTSDKAGSKSRIPYHIWLRLFLGLWLGYEFRERVS